MDERIKTGIKGLDKMLGGGLFSGTVTVVKGASGTGKSNFGIEFISRGIEKFGQPGLYINFEEFPDQLYRDAKSIGFDFRKYVQDKKLKILSVRPETFLSQLRRSGGEFDQIMVEQKVERVVVDSISHVIDDQMDKKKLRQFLYSFVNGLRRHKATSLLCQEDTALLGSLSEPAYGLSFIVDTLIQLKYVEIDSTLDRALIIIKQRATNHDDRIHRFRITNHGIDIEEPFKDKEGILSGSPRNIMRRVEDFYD